MRPSRGRNEASNLSSGAGHRNHNYPTAPAMPRTQPLVQSAINVESTMLFCNLLSDHDLITTAHVIRDTLCARDLMITTTIIGSIAHNLSA